MRQTFHEQVNGELRGYCQQTVGRIRLLGPLLGAVVVLAEPDLRSSRIVYNWQVKGPAGISLNPALPDDELNGLEITNLSLYGGEGRMGALLLRWERGFSLSRDQRAILNGASEELARSLEHVQLLERLRQESERQEAIEHIAQQLEGTTEQETGYEVFSQALKKYIDFDRLGVNLIDTELGYFVKKFLAGPIYSGLRAGNACLTYSGQIQHLIQTGQTLIRRDISNPLMFPFDQKHMEAGLRSSIAVPVFSAGAIIGVLCLRSRRFGAYGDADRESLELLSERIAPILEKAMLMQRLRAREMELETVRESVKAAAERAEMFAEHGKDGLGISNPFNGELAHTLRSPLTSIKGYATSLLREDVEWSEDLSREFLETIDREADRLDEAVTQLLSSGPSDQGPDQS